jgi:predicted MFS family arabinose efflux permease
MLPTYTGVLLTCGGIGGLLGTALCAYALKRLTLPLLICFALWVQGVVFFLLILAPSYWALAVLFVLSYALWPTFNAALASYRLARIPDALQGRVNAIYQQVGYAAGSLGAILMSILLAQEGIIVATVARSALLLLAALLTTLAFLHWRTPLE